MTSHAPCCPPIVVTMMKHAGIPQRPDGRFVGEGMGGYVDELLHSYLRYALGDDSTAVSGGALSSRCALFPEPPGPHAPRVVCPTCATRVRGWHHALLISLVLWGIVILSVKACWR